MFTVTKALEKALLQHFEYKKLDIAYAINKPFPFFEALRDNSVITDRLYKESLEACQNLVPLPKVVHNVLTSLERTFCPSMLVTLFSPVNLHEYPRLSAISRSFKNVVTAYGGNKRPAQTVLKASTNPAEGRSFQTLQPLPPPQPSSPSHLSSAPRVCEPQASSQQIIEILDEQSSPSHPAVPPPGFIQKGKTTPAASNNVAATTDKEEDLERMPSVSPDTVQMVKDDSPAPNDQEMPQKAPSTPANKKAKKRKRCIWSAPKRRCPKKRVQQGVASPGHGVQKQPRVAGQRTQRKDDSTRNLEMVTRAQKARTKRARTSRSQEISNGAPKTNGRKRPQKTPSKPPGTTQGKPKDDTEDFLSPTLPVTCGKAKGILFKEKMKQGASEKCIQNEAGDWFTPKEFLIEGERARSKDWKKTIRCKAKTLRFLEKEGLLLCTSNSNFKKRVTSR
ncbi:sp110 nuclear body protein isoform X4 [Peromyscus maniculatus bairdii]|uniref:sp110 nuclear body protein isoform X4 n=1 Tax=Peromyscus maniculatus bairdii TaxID=230844 RepID=UPI001C2E01F9|nr:sp110 nuclear body protein isoform X4 [Peromyscus maniculatus bairdii]